MSTLSYEQSYRETLAALKDAKYVDASIPGFVFISLDDIRNTVVPMYMEYIRIMKKLSLLHEVELQPQKLWDIRSMLETCIIRVLEFKNIMAYAGGAFFSVDDVLLDVKSSFRDFEIPIPSYILNDRAEELKDRRNVILSLQRFFSESEPESPVSLSLQMPMIRDDPTKAIPPLPTKKAPPLPPKTMADKEQEPMPFEEAVQVLQICERGRQARQRAKFQLSLYHQQRYSAIHGQDFNTVTGKDRAAAIVQTVVQGYLERKRAVERYKEEGLFLGMKPSAFPAAQEAEAARRRVEERKAKQKMNIMELRQKRIELEAGIKATEGPKTMETMLDEILMQMAYARLENKDGQPIELPPSVDGGSELPANANANSPADERGSKADGGDGGNGAKGTGSTQLQNVGSIEHRIVDECEERDNAIWKKKFTDTYLHDGNMDLPFDENVLRKELLEGPAGIMHQLRLSVDDLVRMEVANLKERLEWERKNKRKAKKKNKKEKQPKKPKLKDPTKGVDLASMTNSLVLENKLQLPPSHIRLKDFIGGENVMCKPLNERIIHGQVDDELKKKWARVLRGWNNEISESFHISQDDLLKLYTQYYDELAPAGKDKKKGKDAKVQPNRFDNLVAQRMECGLNAGELRRSATELAVLPLGSQLVHQKIHEYGFRQISSPSYTSLFFYGLPQSGKTMLAFAICNESGSNFFNLSPGNFRTTKGIAKQIQLVFYLARMKSPSIIYIENIERVFPGQMFKGKAKKKDQLVKRGKKIKKELVKMMKTVTAADRVIFIFVSSEPWLTDIKFIDKFVFYPMFFDSPSYASRMELLRKFIAEKLNGRYEGLDQQNLQEVALLSEGYFVGQLQELVDVSLHPRRIQCIPQRKLDANDFIAASSVIKACPKETNTLMKNFMLTILSEIKGKFCWDDGSGDLIPI